MEPTRRKDTTMSDKAETETKSLKSEWDRERKLRMEILEIQHAETMALHAEFEARQQRGRDLYAIEAEDHASAIQWRTDWFAAVNEQAAAMNRVAAALEKLLK